MFVYSFSFSLRGVLWVIHTPIWDKYIIIFTHPLYILLNENAFLINFKFIIKLMRYFIGKVKSWMMIIEWRWPDGGCERSTVVVWHTSLQHPSIVAQIIIQSDILFNTYINCLQTIYLPRNIKILNTHIGLIIDLHKI